MAKTDSLGTRWHFTVHPGRMGVVYGIEADGVALRIAPSDDGTAWRIDKADSMTRMGGPWVAVTRKEYGTPQDAAKDLIKLHKSGVTQRFSSELEQAWGRVAVEQYNGLWDAAEVTGIGTYKGGPAHVYYANKKNSRDFIMGPEFVMKHSPEKMPHDIQSLVKTHTLVGSMAVRSPNQVFEMMQGENWSPHGEARTMIRKLGLDHTSMSVGDVVVFGMNSKMLMVDRVGFYDLLKGGKSAGENPRTASAGSEIFRQFVDPRKFYALEKSLKAANDEQSVKLLQGIQKHFTSKFDMSANEESGWNRFLNMLHDGGRWDADLLRNNVFKVANAIGMSLPSGMFASTAGEMCASPLEQQWGPVHRQAATRYNVEGEMLTKGQMLAKAKSKEVVFMGGDSKPTFHAVIGGDDVFKISQADYEKSKLKDTSSAQQKDKFYQWFLKKKNLSMADAIEFNIWAKGKKTDAKLEKLRSY